ncbi:plasmid pRiA4b ORF-3 family protein (plasmid) [Carnobacterium maltaromaticum]|uniref:plasmid pRiA4b ORF-3 family protein n=1 Tax=Carnobacterium maltaromaticum TaxID=2751 RepID=UPI003450509F
MAKHLVYQFYAELKGYEPKIWRRFKINGEKTMAEFAYTIMILFEMQASHLFRIKQNNRDAMLKDLQKTFPEKVLERFEKKYADIGLFKNVCYELMSGDIFISENEYVVEANQVKLSDATQLEGILFDFEYDFGDSWEISLVLEMCKTEEVSLAKLPCVTDGEGYGIVEDVGGTHGLTQIAETLKQGEGEEHENVAAWLDSTTLNLEEFDREDMDFRLKKLIRLYRDSYEYGYEPTKKSLGVLLRKYKNKGSRGY